MFMPDTDELPPLDRNEVERFSLSFWVVGGRPPYVVTSPDAHAPVSSAAGVLRIACGIPTSSSANPGERAYLPRDAGPLTITVSVTDADGATGSAEVVVVMSPGALSFLRDDGVCREIVEVPGMEKPGHTYVLGTSSVWTLVTLAPSLDLRFEGLDGNGIATFADRETGWGDPAGLAHGRRGLSHRRRVPGHRSDHPQRAPAHAWRRDQFDHR